MNNKKLYRSLADKKLCGVCGGLGEYFEVDPTLIRLLWVIFTFMGGAGLLAYIICAAIIPERTGGGSSERSASNNSYTSKPSDDFDNYFKK